MKMPDKLLVVCETKDDGIRIALCPQLGLLATSATEKGAVNGLIRLIAVQIAFARKHDRLGEIFRPTHELHLNKKESDDGLEVLPAVYAQA